MKSQLRIAVVGGSLGGLNVALFLRDLGHDVHIYERSKSVLVGLGAGIVLNPATVRYLAKEASFDLDAISVRSSAVRYMDQLGSWAAERQDKYRFSSYNALYRGLFDAFGQEKYHLGETLVGIQNHDIVAIAHFASGKTVTCDLLICADGVHSTGRTILMQQAQCNANPHYAGYVAWRGIVSQGESAAEVYELLRDAIVYHLMPHSHLLTYPIPMVDRPNAHDAPFINWLWYRNLGEGAELNHLMTDVKGIRRDLSISPGAVQSEAINHLMLDAAALPSPLTQLVRQTKSPFIQAIVDYEPPFMKVGRVCLLGDAAFVVRPHAAAGSAKAVEDGYQLAQALARNVDNIPAALEHWESQQLSLGQQLVARARLAGERSQVSSSWQVGDPLPFGLYQAGDSLIEG